MLYQYYQYRPYLIGVAYIYGFIGLLGLSVESLRQPTSLTSQLLGLIGLSVSVWLFRLGLRQVGLLEVKTLPVDESRPDQPADLLKAKRAILKKLDSYYWADKPEKQNTSDDVLMVTRDDSQAYRCRFNYHDLVKDIFFSYDYTISLEPKLPVYISKLETLSPLAPNGDSICYQADEAQPASHDELFELYQRLDCLVE